MDKTNDKNKKMAKVASYTVLFILIFITIGSMSWLLFKDFSPVTGLYVLLPIYQGFLIIKNANLKTSNFRSISLDLIIPMISGYLYLFLAFLNIQFIERNTGIRNAGFNSIPDLLIWSGYFLVLFSVIYLRKYFTVFAEANGLVKKGPYRFIRNPIYTGYILSAIGGLIKYYSLEVLIFMSISFVLYFVRAFEEEKLLQEKFKEEYTEYKSHTGRFFPKIF